MEKLKPNNQVRRAVTSCKLGKTMKVYNPNIWETFYSHFFLCTLSPRSPG